MRLVLVLLFAILSLQAFAESNDDVLHLEAEKKGIKLSEEDKKVLRIGEISTVRYVTGGLLGTYPVGLGIGHAIQGRYRDTGYIFTAGELASAGVVIVGALGCLSRPDTSNGTWECSNVDEFLIVGGIVSYIGFRIWEIVDVWAVPPFHNKKFRNLKDYIEKSETKPQVKSSLDLVPVISPRMGQGLGPRFVF